MRNKILIGQSGYGELYYAEINEDGIIRGFDGYDFISKEQSYDDNQYLHHCSWTHNITINGVEYKSGMKLADNIEPFFQDEDIKQIILNEDYYEANGGFCSECGAFHDTEQYYNLSYVVTEDCELLCKSCANAEDLIELVETGSDLFSAKDITGMVFATDDFEEVATLFCDSSGFGRESEPALTVDQAEKRTEELLEEHGELYAGLTGIGMFQVYVALYKRKQQAMTA